MRYLIIGLLTLCCLTSCKYRYNKNLEKMAEITRAKIDEAAFKDNATIDWIEYKPLGYDTLTSLEYREYVREKFEFHNSVILYLIKNSNELADSYLEKALEKVRYGYDHAGNPYYDADLDEHVKWVKEAKRYTTELQERRIADSLLMMKLSYEKHLYYRFKFFVKYTRHKDGKSDNTYGDQERIFSNEFVLLNR